MGVSKGSRNLATNRSLHEANQDPAYSPEVQETLLKAAKTAHRIGDLKTARQLYQQILEKEANGEAAAALGALLRTEGETEELCRHYNWAIRNCNWTPILIYNACNLLSDQGNHSKSIQLVEQGLQRWPKDIHLRWRLALNLHHEGKIRQAKIKLQELITEQGERPLLLEELAA